MKRIVLLSMVSATVAVADPKADQQKAREQAIEEARKAGIIGTKGPQENYELFKLLGPILDCDGTVTTQGKRIPFNGVMHEDTALDGMWLHEWFEGTVGKTSIAFDAHLGFDPQLKRWTRIEVSSRGYSIAHAGPLANGRLEWETDGTALGGKTMKGKTHLDASDPKVVKVTGEASVDGKTWDKTVEMTCKKH